MPHPLDHPVWSALTGHHAGLAIGTRSALRYPADVSPFVAARDDSPESLKALAALVQPGETVVLVRSAPIVLPPDLEVVTLATAVQMVASGAIREPVFASPELLGPDDHAAMYQLATLTRPGPFAPSSMTLGTFWGVREHGRLVAMAGERLRQDDWTELSGVCVHPDRRGQGLGRLLSGHVADRILAQGERPYLHVFASNSVAIDLYRSLGFQQREEMNVVVARRRSLP
jgi:predicted GNAT family acetyltransferase